MITSTNHHPDENMLIEFSAGTLDTAASICVSAHLHFCSTLPEQSCCAWIRLARRLMSQAEPVEVADDAFASGYGKNR